MKREIVTIIEHFENGRITFATEEDFVSFVRELYYENEEQDTDLKRPSDYAESFMYLVLYCSNFKMVGSSYLYS